jgi:hypothetical protein
MKGRKSQRLGSDFELVVVQRLLALDVRCVERVATPMVKVRGVWVRGRKVSCDIKGIIAPAGTALQVECKLRPSGTLWWSDLAQHQHENLQACVEAGGVAIIAFSNATDGIQFLNYSTLRYWHSWGPNVRLENDAIRQAWRNGMFAICPSLEKPPPAWLKDPLAIYAPGLERA